MCAWNLPQACDSPLSDKHSYHDTIPNFQKGIYNNKIILSKEISLLKCFFKENPRRQRGEGGAKRLQVVYDAADDSETQL